MKSTGIFAPFFALILAACCLTAPARAQSGPPAGVSYSFGDGLMQGILVVESPTGQVLYTENDLATLEGLPQSLVTQMVADPDMNLSSYAAANLPSMTGPLDTDFAYVWDGYAEADSAPGWSATPPPSQLLSANGSIISGSINYGTGEIASMLEAAVTGDLINNGPAGAAVVSSTVQTDVGDEFFNFDNQAYQPFPYVASVDMQYDTDTIVEKEAGVVPEASSWILLAAGLAGLGLLGWDRRRKAAR